jgi:hypothetical protein
MPKLAAEAPPREEEAPVAEEVACELVPAAEEAPVAEEVACELVPVTELWVVVEVPPTSLESSAPDEDSPPVSEETSLQPERPRSEREAKVVAARSVMRERCFIVNLGRCRRGSAVAVRCSNVTNT